MNAHVAPNRMTAQSTTFHADRPVSKARAYRESSGVAAQACWRLYELWRLRYKCDTSAIADTEEKENQTQKFKYFCIEMP
ncbi:hypothetical protein PoB_004480300 [Plakobranchus ocellatus]|uniref:Uncharacterized protein n=1 Tax=Plakobranchus ocellatus TaxID=259542 RepID=A0AAV4BHJ5_9GAST|nr:hypothetical protein PoB_004480300 [Plakobranchus ocellatus]